MSIEINLAGKVVLITGASQGIGAQMARTFHRAGATVALNHPDLGTTRQDAEVLAAELNRLRPQSAHVVVRKRSVVPRNWDLIWKSSINAVAAWPSIIQLDAAARVCSSRCCT